tara:strand:- start:2640 stop:2819 length:180 start_codon:yes stop_codon:yes gene_type:complete
MTDAEWKKEEARLKGAVTRAKSKVKTVGTLAEKITVREVQKKAEEALRLHRLSYFDLVA